MLSAANCSRLSDAELLQLAWAESDSLTRTQLETELMQRMQALTTPEMEDLRNAAEELGCGDATACLRTLADAGLSHQRLRELLDALCVDEHNLADHPGRLRALVTAAYQAF